jgi:hypothetical protein
MSFGPRHLVRGLRPASFLWTATALALLLLLSRVGIAAALDTSIAPGVAGLFVDEEKVVEGPVTAAERDGTTVRLRLGNAPQSLTVSLIIGLFSNFPPEPERYYLGKSVRVVGTIRDFRGALEIVLHDPAHIEVIGVSRVVSGERPPAAAPAANDAVVGDTVDALKQRVRELEEKVRQLELERGGSQGQ